MTTQPITDTVAEDMVDTVLDALPHSAGCLAHGGDCLCAVARGRLAGRIVTALLVGPLAPLTGGDR